MIRFAAVVLVVLVTAGAVAAQPVAPSASDVDQALVGRINDKYNPLPSEPGLEERIPGLIVSAVCHAPYCAHPSYTQGYYDRDNAFYLAWDEVSADPQRLSAWLDEWVFSIPDRAAYWDKLGPDVHDRLHVEPRWSQPVNYGAY